MYTPEDQRFRVEARQEKIRRWRPASQPKGAKPVKGHGIHQHHVGLISAILFVIILALALWLM